jgi:PAS domain S-box-containing protein
MFPFRFERPAPWTAAILISVMWLVVVAVAVIKINSSDRIVVALAGLGAVVLTFLISSWAERARWRGPVSDLANFANALINNRRARPRQAPPQELLELTREIATLAKSLRLRAGADRAMIRSSPAQPPAPQPSSASLTRSGLFDSPPQASHEIDPNMSGDYSTIDMVNRLEPADFRWIESSPAEQEFLGYTLTELRERSFLDVLHPDDRHRAEQTFSQALSRGEALGLVVRVRTGHGKTRAVEVNVGARYGNSQRVSHLRCHLTDVSDKVRAERELRIRTRELTQVNDQLRKINRELEDLKDRYTDLYENAPAMYFSLDLHGRVIDCNQTMLSNLKQTRHQVVGRPYQDLLHVSQRANFAARYQDFLRRGSVEKETCWVDSDGDRMDVWILGTVVAVSKDLVSHARFVAQDVTDKRLLEAQLQEKNQRLAQANDELSLRNRELDEFVYVVSHDLQEPLRTLIAFSDFLLDDYGDRLETEGQEYVRYLVDASRRMRAMIHGMLHLSRVGRVLGDFGWVDLDELVGVVKADLGELLRSKNAELRIKSPLPRVWGDRDRIGQLLVNLVSNGIKYNVSPRPWVEVAATAHAGTDSPDRVSDTHEGADVTITVADNGIGIEPQFHRTIFQLFRRLHARDEYEGTGVGLSICNKIVQAHGGAIWVASAPGHGSTFFIRLRGGPSQQQLEAVSMIGAAAPAPHDETQSVADERH